MYILCCGTARDGVFRLRSVLLLVLLSLLLLLLLLTTVAVLLLGSQVVLVSPSADSILPLGLLAFLVSMLMLRACR